jgi:hypothetical protein
MLLFASPFALAAVGEAISDYRHADWPEVTGRVTDVRYAPVKRWSPPRFEMAVRYEVNGRPYWHRHTGRWELPEDIAVPVFHHPDDPRRATFSNPRVYSSRLVATIAAGFLILLLLPRRIVDRLSPTPRFPLCQHL